MSSPPGTGGEPEIVTGSREQLFHLLAEASEIEHSLMCSYLYAAFSLKSHDAEGLSAAEGKAVARWRKAIMGVAIEEMGHLMLVANLTVAIGGRPHFARPNFPVAPGYFSAGVVVRLSGFSAATLDHFIFLERPLGVEGDDPACYEAPDAARDQHGAGLMPSAQDYTTIGHLYEAIRQNLSGLVRKLGEQDLFLGGRSTQVDKAVAGLDGVAAIDDLAGAYAAIDLIVEQGEGSPADREESHYRSFLAVRDEFTTLLSANPGFEPAWPVADNPVLRHPPEPQGKVHIDAPEAAAMLDFACASYGLLLRVLGQMFGRTGSDIAGDQKTLMSVAFELMHALGAAASELATLPASTATPQIHAGMSFTMLRGVEPLLADVEAVLLREQLSLLGEARLASHFTAGLRDAAAALRLASDPRP
jgi:hypothetical protein